MLETNEYVRVMEKLYNKSLILESPSDFHPVLHFYFTDALAHIDFTATVLAYNPMSPRNIMSMEYAVATGPGRSVTGAFQGYQLA